MNAVAPARRTALALLALVGACHAEPAGAPDRDGPDRPPLTATVTRVIDGDSFRAAAGSGEIEVRLLGINAPELDECYGSEAAAFLREAIDGRRVDLDDEGTDQFGRTLARVIVEGVSLNLEAVASGHALALSAASIERELIRAEDAARGAGEGMWGEAVCGATGPRATLAIRGVEHDPPGPDEIERVLIENVGDRTVDLTGFVLRDESSANRFRFPAYLLGPGESVSVVSGSGDLPGDGLGWITAQPVWNNEGDTALVLDPHGRVVAVYRY